MEMITKEQQRAINSVNRALKKLQKVGVMIAAMDSDLLYATKQSIDACTNYADYSAVARCNQHGDEGSGYLYSEGFEDSGGW